MTADKDDPEMGAGVGGNIAKMVDARSRWYRRAHQQHLPPAEPTGRVLKVRSRMQRFPEIVARDARKTIKRANLRVEIRITQDLDDAAGEILAGQTAAGFSKEGVAAGIATVVPGHGVGIATE